MAKRIFKIIGIVLLAFVVLTGGIIGVVALTGGFKKEEIPITNLYFEKDEVSGEYIKNKQIQTLDDIKMSVKFEPANATNTELIVEVVDDYNILSNEPSTVKAGKDFELQLNHDERGNNIGGFATLRFKAGIEWVDLTVFVDVAVPDNAIYFTGDMSSKITTSGKTFSMAISDNTQYVYLNSQLINSFDLKVNNENIKNVQIGYDYYYTSGKLYESKVFEQSELAEALTQYINDKNGYNDSCYKIPIVTDVAGTVDIWAKMHRTAEIESAFFEAGFDKIIDIMNNSGNSDVDHEQSILLLTKYNNFLNKYIEYFDTTDETYEFFQNNMVEAGTINLTKVDQVKQSLDYVYAKTSATINVTAIKLDDFVSIANQTGREFNVFETVSYSISGKNSTKIDEEFGLKIITDNEDASGVETEKQYMFESLKVNPYIYVKATEVEFIEDLSEKSKIKWANKEYVDYISVYGFNGHTPILEESDDGLETGYLIRLVHEEDYLTVSQTLVEGEKNWNITGNVPLQNDQAVGEDIYKALYLCFEISGIDSKENILVTKQAFTRVHINYTDFEFTSDGIDNLVINNMSPYMTINTTDISVNSNSSYYEQLPSERYIQDISLNTDTYVTNFDEASYTNVMYFVESNSNAIGVTSKKVATVGTYKFLNYANVMNPNSEQKYYTYNGEDLQGQRIPTYDSITKKHYIHALNSSDEPVKVFAIVYLSDKNGNPIDVNGRKIEIDEENPGNAVPELVVMRISDITDGVMPEIRIDSFVDNINFYTESIVDYNEIDGVSFAKGFLNRNHVNYYNIVDGDNQTTADETTLKKIQDFLRIKLLKNNAFTIYLTPFDLDETGKAIATKTSEILSEDIKGTDIFGGALSLNFSINSDNNKLQAFNNLLKDIGNYSLHIGGGDVSVKNERAEIVGEGMDTKLKWEILSLRDDNSVSNPVIYLDPTNSILPYSSELIPNASSGGSSSTTTQNQKNNYVLFDTHKLDIYDVVLDKTIQIQNSINVKYAELGNTSANPGDLVFTVQGAISEYELELEKGNLAFDVITNLVYNDSAEYDDQQKASNLDLSIVDCSQAVWSSANTSNTAEARYSCIKSYIEYFIKDTNNTELEYSRTGNMMSFAEDAIFTNQLSGEYSNFIYFGTEKYSINTDEGGQEYVQIGGYKIFVEQNPQNAREKYFVIKQGSYFPMISEDKALIYNTIFDITSDNTVDYYVVDYKVGQDYSGNKYFINKSATINVKNDDGEVVATNYDVNNYVESDILNITEIEAAGQKATLNFKHGEEVWTYVEDANGDYKRVENSNGVGYTYEIAESNYSGTTYSLTNKIMKSGSELETKMGAKVYLLIYFPIIKNADGKGSEFEFYKTIEFELLQEDIDVQLMYQNNLSGTADNRQLIVAGTKANKIKFTSSTAEPYFDISAQESFFFQHVSFSIDTPSVSGISYEHVENREIRIDMPHVLGDQASFILKMSYPYKDSTREEEFYFYANPDIEFEYDSNLVKEKIVSETEKYYVLSIDSNQEYNIYNTNDANSIFMKYFKINSNQISKVQFVKNGFDSNNHSISLGNAFATYDGSNITKDSVEFGVKLTLEDGTIDLEHKLLININPKYIVDWTALNGQTQTIFNNENIFVNYVKLYNPDSTLQNISQNLVETVSEYSSVFTIEGTDDLISNKEGDTTKAWIESGKLSINNGRIRLFTTPTEDITLNFKIFYNELNYNTDNSGQNYRRELTFSVTIRGVDIETTREFVDGNMTIYIEEGKGFNLDDYITMSLLSSELEITPFLSTDLTESLDNAIVGESALTAGTYTYYLGYGKSTVGQGMKFIEYVQYGTKTVEGGSGTETEIIYYTVTINVYSKTMKYSSTGLAANMNELIENVSVTINQGDTFDITKYLSVELSSNAPDGLVVTPILCMVDSNDEVITSSIKESAITGLTTGSHSYFIAYKIADGERIQYEATEYILTIVVE